MSDKIIAELRHIKNESGINYSIHLPIDLDLLNNDKKVVNQSYNIIESIAEKTSPLEISNFILHIDKYSEKKHQSIALSKKNYELFENILVRIKNMFKEKYNMFYIENLSYDLIFFKDIILKHNFSICLDIGHIYIYNHDLDLFIKCFENKIKEVHLHGFSEGKDHISIKHIKKEYLIKILTFLKNYNDSLIIEVFNKKDLLSSAKILKNSFIFS